MLSKLQMKTAIVHEWFVDYSGSERVVEQMINVLPQADMYAMVEFLPDSLKGFIQNKSVTTSLIQKLPLAKKKYRYYLPLMPIAVEQFDLSKYDLVISSNHAVSKGVLTGPDQLHICMCYSPIRYAWDLQHQYLKETNLDKGIKALIAKLLLHYIRLWDVRTSNGVDHFIAISHFVKRRIKKCYNREATVIYPPVDIGKFTLNDARDSRENFYLTASRMVPYKKIDLIVEAFSEMPDKALFVIGNGPDYNKIRLKAGGNIKLMGYQPCDVLKEYMQRAKAFVFAAEEDFGITPLEAQACGTPVIAYDKGGASETIIGMEQEHPTGIFFREQSRESLISAVRLFESVHDRFNAKICRQNAIRFSPERFRDEFSTFVEKEWHNFQKKLKS